MLVAQGTVHWPAITCESFIGQHLEPGSANCIDRDSGTEWPPSRPASLAANRILPSARLHPGLALVAPTTAPTSPSDRAWLHDDAILPGTSYHCMPSDRRTLSLASHGTARRYPLVAVAR